MYSVFVFVFLFCLFVYLFVFNLRTMHTLKLARRMWKLNILQIVMWVQEDCICIFDFFVYMQNTSKTTQFKTYFKSEVIVVLLSWVKLDVKKQSITKEIGTQNSFSCKITTMQIKLSCTHMVKYKCPFWAWSFHLHVMWNCDWFLSITKWWVYKSKWLKLPN